MHWRRLPNNSSRKIVLVGDFWWTIFPVNGEIVL